MKCMPNIRVSDIMTRDPLIAKPEDDLLQVAKRLVKNRTGSLLLVKHKRLVGFITHKDLLWAMIKKSKEDLTKIPAIDISPKKLATIRPSASLEEAIKKMRKFKFNRLPVIYKGELVGLITARDILTFNPELYPELDEFSQVREEADKLRRIKKAQEREIQEGPCEECGNVETLKKIDGMMICDSCANIK